MVADGVVARVPVRAAFRSRRAGAAVLRRPPAAAATQAFRPICRL